MTQMDFGQKSENKKLVEPFTKMVIKNLAFEYFSNRMEYNFFG